MFAAPNLKWNEPAIPEFDPKTFPVLLEKLGRANCHAFLCRRCEWTEEIPPPWKKVFGKPDDHRALWIIANRSMDVRAENTTGFGEIRKLPIYDDHEITPASKFRVIMVGLASAPAQGVPTLVIAGFVVWVLATEGSAFRPPDEG